MHTYNVQSANHIEIPQPRKQIKVIRYVNTATQVFLQAQK